MESCRRFLGLQPFGADMQEAPWENRTAVSTRPSKLLSAMDRIGLTRPLRAITPAHLRRITHGMTREPMPKRRPLSRETINWIRRELADDVASLLAFTSKPADFWKGWPLEEEDNA